MKNTVPNITDTGPVRLCNLLMAVTNQRPVATLKHRTGHTDRETCGSYGLFAGFSVNRGTNTILNLT